MAGDLIKVRLSREANDVANRMVETGFFDYAVSAAKFALAYAIKYHFDEINPETYTVPDSEGSNYNIGTIDSDNQLATFLRALYPETTTPYLYARALIIFGLTKLGERIEREGLSSISTFL